MTAASSSGLVFFPPARDPGSPFDPPHVLLDLQRDEPVTRVAIWDGTEAWLVTKYEDVRQVLNDERFSANPTHPGFPEKSAAYRATLATDVNLRTLDNPEHDRQKRMIIRDLTVRRVEAMRPSMQAKADSLIDAMLERGAADIVSDYAFPMPTMVICELLGVPYERREWFARRAALMLSHTSTPDAAAQAGEDLNIYLAHLLAEKGEDPVDDLTSRLAVEQVATGELPLDQAISTLRFLLVAGYETTANMISLSTLALLMHPEEKQILIDDPAPDIVANAVEELLRYLSVSHSGRRRVAVADVEVGGRLIRAGEGVIAANSVADRDESIFPVADALDLRRANARSNVTFGYGMHHCVGQLLARVELQVVLGTLFRRIPTLRLAIPFADVSFDPEGTVYGLHSLPVAWD